MSPVRRSFLLLAAGLSLSSLGAAATTPPACPPCGAWRLESSDDATAAVDAAMAKYKPRKPRMMRVPTGDIAAESEAEFHNSLEMPQPGYREELRAGLLKLATSPAELKVRLDGEDVVVEAAGGPTRRVTPGEPHARVDSMGTAEIASKWRRDGLLVTETYTGKTNNREAYVVDAAHASLTVTRTFERRGLPDVVVHSHYVRGTP
jgi:hypothetical protein